MSLEYSLHPRTFHKADLPNLVTCSFILMHLKGTSVYYPLLLFMIDVAAAEIEFCCRICMLCVRGGQS